jgi:hypothetical protein
MAGASPAPAATLRLALVFRLASVPWTKTFIAELSLPL